MNSLILVTLFVVAAVAHEDYCNPQLCGTNTHIACAPDGQFNFTTCPLDGQPEQVDLSGELQALILAEHNKYRSQIAMGQVPGYKTGSKMLESKWDDDLAYVSGFNARGCIMKHDDCRATTRYPYSGQNLASIGRTLSYTDNAEALKRMIGNWFLEYPNTNQAITDRYQSVGGKMYGHFTALVQQKSGHVGCSLVRYRNGKWFLSLLACNYEYTNMIGDATYTQGAPCSQCQQGCSQTYPGLCTH